MASGHLTHTPGDRAPGGTPWDPEVQSSLCFLSYVGVSLSSPVTSIPTHFLLVSGKSPFPLSHLIPNPSH